MGMQTKLQTAETMRPENPVHLRPTGFQSIRNMQRKKAGISTAPAMNVLMKMLP